MATSYRPSLGISTSRKDGVALYSELIARDTQPNPNRGGKKLLDQPMPPHHAQRERGESWRIARVRNPCHRLGQRSRRMRQTVK